MTFDSTITWDDQLKAWVDENGEPIPEQRLTDEVFSHADAAQENMTNLTLALYAGLIDIEDWQTANALELQDMFVAQSAFAVGGVSNLDAAAMATTAALLASQLGFLSGFGEDIAAGNVSQAQAIDRINQYGNAGSQAYWGQWQNQQDNGNFSTLHNLTRIPQDGSTPCRGKCRCHLEHNDDGIYWVVDDGANHCGVCPEMQNGNPWSPML